MSPHVHRPAPGRPVPVSTYRLQIQPEFGFADAARQVHYLRDLGVSHAYLSPILRPTPGSTHGYDVIDHDVVNPEAGGEAALRALAAELHAAGLGAIADVVPNHMAVPVPEHLNAPLWAVLREGRESPYAAWFDVDWDSLGGRLLMPVLGASLEEVLAAGELTVVDDGGPGSDETVLRYYEHEFPLRDGTATLPLPELVAAQHYELAFWQDAHERLNYRRFFDVTSLMAIRVEEREVFDASHRLLASLLADGTLDGLRIDHPDGLADPGGYLDWLADLTGGAWVVVEKILEDDERLPDAWRCAGTTGYDAALRVGGLFVDPSGEPELTRLWQQLSGDDRPLAEVVDESKRLVVATIQHVEVERLMRLVTLVLPGEDPAALRRALEAVLVSMHRYRAYLTDGQQMQPDAALALDEALARAGELVPDDAHAVAVIGQLARGGDLPRAEGGAAATAAAAEFRTRFQQTCGPVMAKGIEDTAFYRYLRLTGLNEVGGAPDRMGLEPGEFHDFATRLHEDWPTTMTLLSTHDTKRAEDVRARLSAVSEHAEEWTGWLQRARELAEPHRDNRLDAATEYLLWQTAVGTWPIDAERLSAYSLKAVREAKTTTTWTEPDTAYEHAVTAFAEGITGDADIAAHIEGWHALSSTAVRAVTLGQKLVQLTMPGVPDTYQGTEVLDYSLVDPDNRRPVDYDLRAARLARLDAGADPEGLADEKLLVVSRALRLRRDHPGWFTGEQSRYEPVPASSPHAVAFARGDEDGPQVLTVATRLAQQLEQEGGWGVHRLNVPAGAWRDLLTGRQHRADDTGLAVADVLGGLPVALMVRSDG